MPSRRQPATSGRTGWPGRSGSGGPGGRSRQVRPPAEEGANDETALRVPGDGLPGDGLPDGTGAPGALGAPGARGAPGPPKDPTEPKDPTQPKDPTEPKDPEAAARAICLRLLTLSPRTRAQLADALQRRHIPAPAAEAVLDRFTEAGLIDDPAFARAWVESRHHGRGLSRRALSAELRRRGVADDDVHEAIELVDPDQEAATARQLIARRVTATRGQPSDARVRKLMGMLARKGYGAALAYRVVREALEAEGAPGPDETEIALEFDEPDPDIRSEGVAW